MIVDWHNHYYPERYLAELARGDTVARLDKDGAGRSLIHYPGDYNVVARGHRELDERVREMDANGVDLQLLSLTTPGVHVEDAKRGVELARIVNDAFAEATERHPGRFAALAALPLQDPEAAVAEARRALRELGLGGVLLFSNINGRSLDDPAYRPLFAELAELDGTIFIHPTNPHNIDSVADYRLTALVGFLFDTSTAAARLVFSGVLERHPDLEIVLGHLGGTIPYVVERIDRGYEAYPECREHISRPPSEYFRKMYVDTVNFHPGALRFAIELMGTDHVVFGTDYPHEVGSVARARDAIDRLELDNADRRRILGENAARLLKL